MLFLCGINVGGKNKLPMAKLVALFEELGCEDVQTYIQSGNVVFEASARLAKTLPAQVSTELGERLGLAVPVQLRSARELRRALRTHPLVTGGVEVSSLHVMFLADRPSAARIKKLDPDRSPGDRFTVIGREIYLCCPNGIARTKLTNAYFDTALRTVCTIRNWRSAQKLLAPALAMLAESQVLAAHSSTPPQCRIRKYLASDLPITVPLPSDPKPISNRHNHCLHPWVRSHDLIAHGAELVDQYLS